MKLIDRIKNRIKFKERLKLQGKGSYLESVGHAMEGIEYTACHERNFRIEIVIGILVTIMGFIFNVSILEWVVLMLTMACVLALEIINTSIERCVDLVTKEYRELARIAKDTSAGAVLLMSMFSVVIGIVIFLPKIIEVIGG